MPKHSRALRITGLVVGGVVVAVSAMRYRDVNGRGVFTPFEGRYDRFERREGVMIPSSAEVAWLLPEGRYGYWRGQPTDVRFDLAKLP